MDRYYDIMLQHYLNAVKDNNIQLVQEALQHNHIMASNQDLDNALILASLNGHYEMIKFLIEQIPEENRKEYISMGNQLGITPIIAACANGNIKVLNYLLKFIADDDAISLPVTDLGNTCLGIACANGHLGIVKYLLTGGASLDMVRGSLCPHPLMLAMLNGHEDILIYFYLPSLAKSPKLKYYPLESQEEIKKSAEFSMELVPDVDIDECCPQFHNLNILALAVVLQMNEMFKFLCQLGADLDAELPETRNSVRRVAENYGFHIPHFSLSNAESHDETQSLGSDIGLKKPSKKHLSLIKKLGKILRGN
uniref:Ankyrin repeat protein n=1 Tax=Panagrolaimus superbus TaxID=310955 RepID=A0A914XWU0_9BILA